MSWASGDIGVRSMSRKVCSCGCVRLGRDSGATSISCRLQGSRRWLQAGWDEMCRISMEGCTSTAPHGGGGVLRVDKVVRRVRGSGRKRLSGGGSECSQCRPGRPGPDGAKDPPRGGEKKEDAHPLGGGAGVLGEYLVEAHVEKDGAEDGMLALPLHGGDVLRVELVGLFGSNLKDVVSGVMQDGLAHRKPSAAHAHGSCNWSGSSTKSTCSLGLVAAHFHSCFAWLAARCIRSARSSSGGGSRAAMAADLA